MNYYLEVIPNLANKTIFEVWLGSKPPHVHSARCLSIPPRDAGTVGGCVTKPFSPQGLGM